MTHEARSTLPAYPARRRASETPTPEKARGGRRHRVVVVPSGPEDPRPLEVLLHAPADRCLAYYAYLREEGPPEYEGRALAVLDGFDRPVYAA